MKNIRKIAYVVSRGFEIYYSIGTIGLAILYFFIVLGMNPFGLYGEQRNIERIGVILFGITAVVTMALKAMIFSNVNEIVKKSEQSPFQTANVKLLKKVGWYAIIAPVVFAVGNLFLVFLAPSYEMEIRLNLGEIAMGVLVLFLTQIFTYGVELQNDVDGLV